MGQVGRRASAGVHFEHIPRGGYRDLSQDFDLEAAEAKTREAALIEEAIGKASELDLESVP